MAISNSFHSSCKNHAIKDSVKLSKVQYHNERGYFDLSYDNNKIVDLIGSSSSIVADTKKYINDTFNVCVDQYNAKQKRNDRKINSSAFEHFEKDKGLDIANESIFQIGDKEFWDKFRVDEVVGKDKNGEDIIIHSYSKEVQEVMNEIIKKQAKAYEEIYQNEDTKNKIINKIISSKDEAESFLNSLDEEKKKEYDKALKKNKDDKKEYYSSLDLEEKKNFINYSKANKDINIIKKLKLIERIENEQMNIKLVNLTAHYDEYSVHAHGISVCSAANYKTGLSSRIAKSVVLNKFSLEVIQERLNQIAKEEIAKHPEIFKDEHIKEKEKGRRFNYTTEQYKRKKVIDLEEKIKTLENDNEQLQNEVKALPKKIDSKPTLFDPNKVTINKKDLEKLEKRAMLSLSHEKASKNLIAEIKEERKETKKLKNDLEDEIDSLHFERIQAQEQAKLYQDKYNSQIALNRSYEALKGKYRVLETENKELKTQNNSLKACISDLKSRLDGMCESLKNVVKAFNLLKYDKDSGYRVELTKKQSRLFDGLENYAKKWLKEEDKHDMAVDIEKHIGLSPGIEKEIKALEPKSRGRDLSL